MSAAQATAGGLALEGGSDDSLGDLARFGVVTVSDRASGGVYDDLSGPAILAFFHEAIKSRWGVGGGKGGRRGDGGGARQHRRAQRVQPGTRRRAHP